MQLKNLGFVVGVVLVAGAGLMVATNCTESRAAAATVPQAVQLADRPAPAEAKSSVLAPTGRVSEARTNAQRQPVQPGDRGGTSAPTGEAV